MPAEPQTQLRRPARRDFLKLGVGSFPAWASSTCSAAGRASAGRPPAAGKSSPANVNCILHLARRRARATTRPSTPSPTPPSTSAASSSRSRPPSPASTSPRSSPSSPAIADKFTVIRSVCHKDPNHGGGNHYMMTGAPTPVPVGCGAFVTFHPSFGSVVSWKRGIRDGLPAYMTMPGDVPLRRPELPRRQPRPVRHRAATPTPAGFKVRDVVLPPEITAGRDDRRQAAPPVARPPDPHHRRRRRRPGRRLRQLLPAGPRPRHLAQGPGRVRHLQGARRRPRPVRPQRRSASACCSARRLVEVGVSFVTCYTRRVGPPHQDLQELQGQQMAGARPGPRRP